MKVKKEEFRSSLSHLINRYGIDSDMNTPDFVIANFILAHLKNLKEYIDWREWDENRNQKEKG